MSRCGVELALAMDKWEMGWGVLSMEWSGLGEERAHGICIPFTLFCLPAHEKCEMETVSKDVR